MSQQGKSIRFQIELPMEDHQYATTPNIHVHINFDQPKQQMAKNKDAATNSSGYSSYFDLNSSGMSLDTSSSSSSEKSFDLDNSKSSQQSIASSYKNHTYNKLADQRFQIPIVKSDQIVESTTDLNNDENIYEDISSFLESNGYISMANKSSANIIEKKPIEKHLYESVDQSNRVQARLIVAEKSKVNHRREYALNEIFENLKKFKQQAKNQETLTRANLNSEHTTKADNPTIRKYQDEHVYINQIRTNSSTLV